MLQHFLNLFSHWRRAQSGESSSSSMEVIEIASSDSENEEGLVLSTQQHYPTPGFLSQGVNGLTQPTRQLPSSFGLQPRGSDGASHMENNGTNERIAASFNNSSLQDSQPSFGGYNGGYMSQQSVGGHNGENMSTYQHFQPHEGPPYYDVDDNMDTSVQPYYAHSSAPMQNTYFPENETGDGSIDSGMSAPVRQFYMENGDDVAYARTLPPSFSLGNDTSQVSNLDSGVHRPGEEMHAGNDESLIYQAALQDLAQSKLLETDVPKGLLSVPLLRHQRIALAWMLQKETSSVHCLGGFLADDQGLGKTVSTIALIQMQRSRAPKATPVNSHQLKPEPLILDDDDDNVDEKINALPQDIPDEKRIDVKKKRTNTSRIGRPSAGTLIVCPASVLRQWARELDDKVSEDAKLNVLVYHGSSRTKDPGDLAKYDVVVTTYSIVSNEVPKLSLGDDDDDEQKNMDKYGISSEFSASNKRKKLNNGTKKGKKGKKGIDDSIAYDSGPLARVGWFRVVLDEAQTIKNYRTLVARACCGLRAKRRWCLSGTPMQNAVDDLYSYFRFLRYDPYANYKSFCSSIKYPIARNSVHGYKKLQAVLKTMMLRRTKETLIDGEPILKLPPKTIYLEKVEFSPEERDFYTRLEADSRTQFKKYADEGTVKQNYANILLLLLRLRQACDHPILVKGFHSHSTGKDSLLTAKNLPKEKQINLLRILEASSAICGACNDIPEDAIVTLCGHVFCYQCVSERLTGDDNSCPAVDCKGLLGSESVFSKNILVSCAFDNQENNGASSSRTVDEFPLENYSASSKIKATMEILHSVCGIVNSSAVVIEGSSEIPCYEECSSDSRKAMHSMGPSHNIPEKVIVFSQWTGMLDLLEKSLKNSSIQYRRFDGTMTLPLRDRAVKDFTTKPEVIVMIMSLKAGNLGLNLISACHVIMLDLWWNPTTEDQAVDRAHRIGQTRPVRVSRLTIKDTVEDRILALQEEKRKMVSSAFGEEKGGGSASRLTVEDLRYLFMGGGND